MKLKEAIKSGKKIKRKSWTYFVETKSILFCYADLCAEDWEVSAAPAEYTKIIAMYSDGCCKVYENDLQCNRDARLNKKVGIELINTKKLTWEGL